MNDNILLRYCKAIVGRRKGNRAETPVWRGKEEGDGGYSDAVEYYFYSLRRHPAQTFAMYFDGVHLLFCFSQ